MRVENYMSEYTEIFVLDFSGGKYFVDPFKTAAIPFLHIVTAVVLVSVWNVR
jgi:hypothetical protein